MAEALRRLLVGFSSLYHLLCSRVYWDFRFLCDKEDLLPLGPLRPFLVRVVTVTQTNQFLAVFV